MADHVIFGTGPIGVAAAKILLAKGKSVKLVSRSGGRDLPEAAEIQAGDASDREFAKKTAAGASVVYFALNPPYNKWPALFPPLQESIVEAAASAEARIISVENVYAYGNVQGATLTEDLPYNATGKKGLARARMAESLMRAHRDGKVQAAIARGSDFFGPRALISQMGERAFRPALTGGKAQFLNGIDQPHTYTFVNDFATALITLGENEEALGKIWHVPNSPTVTTREFVEMIYEEAGTGPAKFSIMPKLMMNLIALVNSMVRELKEIKFEYDHPHIVDHSKITNAFGLQPTPVRDAIKATLDWYRTNPKD